MKKVFALILVAVLALSMTACYVKPSVNINDLINDIVTESNDDIDVDSDDDYDDYDTDIDNDIDYADVDVAEQVIFDKKDIKISLIDIEFEEYWGYNIELLIENNSDIDINVSTDNFSINNFAITGYLSADVSAGKKAYEDISLFESDLEMLNLTSIGVIEFTFDIDDDNWNDIDESDIITITVDKNVNLDYTPTGNKIVDESGIVIYAAEVANDYGTIDNNVSLYIENNTDKNIYLSAEDVSVNGFMIDPYLFVEIPAGKRTLTAATFLNDDLENNHIEVIEEIELSFYAYDNEDYDTILDTDSIKLTFN